MKETQARRCLFVIRFPGGPEEEMFKEWLKIKGRAVEKLCFQSIGIARDTDSQGTSIGHEELIFF